MSRQFLRGLACLATLAAASPVRAEGLSMFPPGPATNQMAQSLGATTSRTLADRLADALSVRDFGAACNGTTDDSPALYAASAALSGSGRTILVPADCRLNLGPASRQAGNPVVLDTVSLDGEGGRDSGNASGVYGTRGSTILLTDSGAPALIVKRNVAIRHLTFYWPGVTEATTTANNKTPPVYPALIAGPGTAAGANAPGDETSSLRFADNDVVNATTVIDVHLDTSGALFIEGNRAFFTGVFLNLGTMPEESFIHDNHFTPAAFGSALIGGSSYNLWNWAAQHAEVVRVTGNGGNNVSATVGVAQGLNFHHNYVFAIGYGLRALGGWFDITDVSDNGFDAVPHVLSIETGGAFDGRFDGGNIISYTSQATAVSSIVTPAFYQSSDSAPGTDINIGNLRVGFTTGQFLDFENGTSPSYATISGSYLSNLNDSPGATAEGIRWNSPSRLTIQGGTISTIGNSPACLNLVSNVQTLMISGVTFINCGYVVMTEGTAGQAVIAGNIALATRTGIYGGLFPQFLPDTFNNWDKTPYGWTQGPRASDGSYVVSYKGTAMLSVSPQGVVKAAGNVTGGTTP